MLDNSLVYLRIVKFRYFNILKHSIWFLFLNLFSSFKDLGMISKICKNNFTQISKCQFSHILYQLVFKVGFHILINFITSILIFNVAKGVVALNKEWQLQTSKKQQHQACKRQQRRMSKKQHHQANKEQ
jgi:hypothetical protein